RHHDDADASPLKRSAVDSGLHAPGAITSAGSLLGERRRAPFKPEANRPLGGGDVATIHLRQQRIRVRPAPLQRRSPRVLIRRAAKRPAVTREHATPRRHGKGFEMDSVRISPAGELARGTEQLACRSGCCLDERLSPQLLSGPLQCPRVVYTDLSWQLSRLLCARGEWPPRRRPAERCDKLVPRPVFR